MTYSDIRPGFVVIVDGGGGVRPFRFIIVLLSFTIVPDVRGREVEKKPLTGREEDDGRHVDDHHHPQRGLDELSLGTKLIHDDNRNDDDRCDDDHRRVYQLWGL